MQIDTNALIRLANDRVDRGKVVLVFSDNRYREVLFNWLVGMHRLGIQNYLVISLDEKIHRFLDEHDIPTFLSPLEGDLSKLWIMRMQIFQALCSAGISFIHSDADAIWLKNPFPAFIDNSNHEIIASQGTTWPADVANNQGFVFCCGFFFVKSCKQTRELLDELATDVAITGDDQISLNRVLQGKSVHWDTEHTLPYFLHHEEQRFTCYEAVITGQTQNKQLTIALLPHHLFQRLHMPGQDAFVKHLLSDKDSESKLDMFQRTDCRFLAADWKERSFSAGTLEKIGGNSQLETLSSERASNIRTLCIALGPYRNLTTLTAGLLSLHPNCQVLNHGGAKILSNDSLNFLGQHSEEKFGSFVDFALSTSAGGERGDTGGSILHSHAYYNQHRLGSLYAARYGTNRAKDSVHSLFWKESLMVSNYIREHRVDLDQLIAENDRLRFLMPVRNPLDCAASNLRTKHADRFVTSDHSILGILKAVLEELLWFIELSERHPGRFFYHFENEFNAETLTQLAGFLNLENDDRWVKDALEAYEIKSTYSHEETLIDFYREQVSRLFNARPDIEKKLLSFVNENNAGTEKSEGSSGASFPSIIIPGKKKVLVYGLQSSGASLFAYFLAQREESLGIIDLNNHRLAPSLDENLDIVLKAVITTRWPLQAHIDNFRPNQTILFVRNPYNNYFSLMQKSYAEKSGAIDDKFRLMNSYFEARDQFDATVYYEDFITDHSDMIEKLTAIGWESQQQHYRFPRSPQDIARFNVASSIWCKENPAAEGPAGGWSMGNIHSSAIELSLSEKPFDSTIYDRVKALCPTLYKYYRDHARLHNNRKPPLSTSTG